jgi:hypothetical protein
MSVSEIAAIGSALYEESKKRLEKKHVGEYVVFDLVTGRYTLGATCAEATQRHREQFAEAPRYTRFIAGPERTVIPMIRRVPEIISYG